MESNQTLINRISALESEIIALKAKAVQIAEEAKAAAYQES